MPDLPFWQMVLYMFKAFGAVLIVISVIITVFMIIAVVFEYFKQRKESLKTKRQ